MPSMYSFLRIVVCFALLPGLASAAHFFDDFSYASGPPGNPTDPQFECFGWYVRTGGGGPGIAGAAWRADYVTWSEDPSLPGNRLMQLRASTDGTAAGTFQSEVDTHADSFHEGTYGLRVKYVDAGAVQPSVQAFSTYKGLLCDLNYSECDIEYTPADPWSTRCGASPALHLQTWEQYCDAPYAGDLTPATPSPICGSLAGWHTLTLVVSNGTVRYYVDGLLRATHGGEYYPESPMRVLLLHWFAPAFKAGVAADLTMEVDWFYHAKDAVLTTAQVQQAVAQLRASGVARQNTIDSFPDCDANGIPDACQPDSDADGLIDACDTTTTWRVNAQAGGGQTGFNWKDAFTTLQAALAVAQPGDEVWVAAGTYRPSPPGSDRGIAFGLKPGVSLYGGFSGTESQRSQRDRLANPTVLSGDLAGDDGSGAAGTAENSYVVVDASGTDASTVLDGFTITGANGNSGGGLFMDAAGPTIRFCTFTGNAASLGAAVCMQSSAPTFTRCHFGNNIAAADGGAAYIALGSTPRFSACTFDGNRAGYAGGAARVLGSSPLFVSCFFRANQAPYGGALQFYDSGGPMVANSLFSGNAATGAGGAIHNTNSSPFVINSTIASNHAEMCGGILGWAPSMAVVANSIIWGNSDVTGSGEQAQITADTALVSSSCVQNWTGLNGGMAVVGADPLFVDADGPDDLPGTGDDNYRLRTGSPCIDFGDNTMVPPDTSDLNADGDTTEPISLDILGYRRFEDGPLAPDNGFGAPPLIDLGPYEYVPLPRADFDYDRDVDTMDLRHFIRCALGPAVPYADPACRDADFDEDGDVDQIDFALLQRSYGTSE